MLKMIIVDDERAIREAIHASIDWNALGISVIGLCRNGAEAYDMIMDEYPDIVLTDIRMPGLSGLELIGRIASAELDTEFVILSGFGEFELAREAMRYGVKHYLLKPVSPETLIATMRSVIDSCYRRRAGSASENAQLRLRNSMVRSALIESLTGLVSLDDIARQRQQYVDFDDQSYELCYFYYLQESEINGTLAHLHAWQQITSLPVHALYVRGALIVFFESFSTDYSDLDQSFSNFFAQQPNCGVEYERHSFPNLRSLLTELNRRLIRFDQITLLDGSQRTLLNNRSRVTEDLNSLVRRLVSVPSGEREACWNELVRYPIGTDDHQDLLKMMLIGHLVRLPDSAPDQELSGQQITQTMLELRDAKSIEDLRKIMFSVLTALDHSSTSESPDLVHRITDYVENNLANPNLSLKWLAENQLFMNVDYVSRLFARKTGEKFSVYLTRTRMERAKTMLLQPGNSVTSVAEQLGFGNNPQYFSQLFRRAVGVTPSEYRAANEKS